VWKLGGLGSADRIIEVVLPGSAVVSCHVTLRSRAAATNANGTRCCCQKPPPA
jgi:hypothetical protein